MEGFAGLTTIEDSAAAVTVRVVDPATEPKATRMMLLPVATPLARPVLLIPATEVFEESQVTEFVRFCVEPSL